jgi:hypothetical protein
MLARKMLHYPEKVNIFLISQFSENQFGLREEERNELSIFHTNSVNILMYLFKKGKYEASLKNLKLRIEENTYNFVCNWKQLNFLSCKDMQYFLRKMQAYFYIKIEKATNKLSFEKRSANEFTVEPFDLERIRHDHLKMSRVSIEFYHWDSNIKKDNELKQRLFDKYEKYRKTYGLKIDQSFLLPKQLIISKCSQLELFHALSVSTNTDQFLEEITTEMRVEMPEIKKNLNVLFSRQALESNKNSW